MAYDLIMIAVIDYGMGNLGSITKALDHVGADMCLTSDPATLAEAERIVLPGVGAFADGMRNLKQTGLADALQEEVLRKGKPFWGICLGMQFIAQRSVEFGEHAGFGWIDAEVVRFQFPDDSALKVPHVGWNNLHFLRDHPMLTRIRDAADFYFVHSYHLVTADESLVLGTCEYGYAFPACIAKGNLFATQFHPEKSQRDGLTMLKNFLTWQP